MEISYDLWLFLQGAELVIHNASFDIGFLDAEFAKIKIFFPPDFYAKCDNRNPSLHGEHVSGFPGRVCPRKALAGIHENLPT